MERGSRSRISDAGRDTGKPLVRFAILAPIGTDEQRGFAVRHAIDNPPEARVARDLVIGKNPVWVFSQEGYERTSHREYRMKPVPDEAEEVPSAASESAPTSTPPHDHSSSDRTGPIKATRR